MWLQHGWGYQNRCRLWPSPQWVSSWLMRWMLCPQLLKLSGNHETSQPSLRSNSPQTRVWSEYSALVPFSLMFLLPVLLPWSSSSFLSPTLSFSSSLSCSYSPSSRPDPPPPFSLPLFLFLLPHPSASTPPWGKSNFSHNVNPTIPSPWHSAMASSESTDKGLGWTSKWWDKINSSPTNKKSHMWYKDKNSLYPAWATDQWL